MEIHFDRLQESMQLLLVQGSLHFLSRDSFKIFLAVVLIEV